MATIGRFAHSGIVRRMALEFTAAGDEATAMQRAQESGCLPETVLAIAVLTDYRIVGSESDNGILQIEPTWPAAWRVQAARSHRALVAGAADDIDIILRVFSEWQSSADPDGWCSTWWINPGVLAKVESDVAAVFESLASSGPLGLRRPVDVSRAPAVRGALADAFENSFFVKAGQNAYRPIGEEPGSAAPPLTPSHAVLVDPVDQIIALGRDDDTGVLEHIISVDANGESAVDALATVRDQWPVGSIVEIETLGSVPSGRMVTDILTLHRGFAYPDGADAAPPAEAVHMPELLAAPAYSSNPIDATARLRVRVLGYRVGEEGQAVLVVDPLAADAPIDPSEHPDLATWDDIELTVRGITDDHLEELVELARSDGYGSFFVPLAAGLSANDQSFGTRLVEGAKLTARTLPEPPAGKTPTVSLLPDVVRNLEAVPGVDNSRPVRGTVVKNDGTFGSITVELAHGDEASGLTHRFTVERGRLMEGFNPVVGDEVDVVLRPDRSADRRRLQADREVADFAAKHPETFVVSNGWLEFAPGPPNIASVLALLGLDDSPEWEREVVWLYEDNLHLEAALIGPAGDAQLAEIAATAPGFLVRPPRYKAGIAPVEPAVADGEEDAAPATAVAEEVDAAPEPSTIEVPDEVYKVVARLPEGAADRVIGQNGETLRELRAGREILVVALADEFVSVVGVSGRAVRSAIAEIQRLILPTKGRLVLPPGGAKRLIGIDGTTLRAMQVRTGCEVADSDDTEMWIVEGPNHAAVKEFLRLASDQVQGVIGRVTGNEDLELVAEETVPLAEVAHLIEIQRRETDPGEDSMLGSAVAALAAADDDAEEDETGPSTAESEEPDPPRRAPIKPLTRDPKKRLDADDRKQDDKAERRAARAEARAEARARARERRAEAKERRAEKAAAKREARESQAAEPAAMTEDRSPVMSDEVASHVLRGVAFVLALTLLLLITWYVVTRIDPLGADGEDDAAISEGPGESELVADAALAAPVGLTFAALEDASAAAPDACWLAVAATWTSRDQATSGVARLHEVGLPAVAVASELIPGWAAERLVGVVPVETEALADDALVRATEAGFSGLSVELPVEECAGLDIVPAGASLGYVDVPATDADYGAILWATNTGLLDACNPPDADRFCPGAPVATAELTAVLEAALIGAPVLELDGTPTVGDLNQVLNMGDTADATSLTRRHLAETLNRVYLTQG